MLGDYELIRPLARGGMAELFLARSVGPEGFEKVIVLKRVLPHLAEDRRFVRAFLDEAKLVASLDHPNIAAVYDMGSADGSYYFTMELVRGVDVRTILQRCKRTCSTLPIEHAVIIARDTAAALHHAHERRGPEGPLGLVHRDVSPSNVIVSFEGTPKLIDFGIAKATQSTSKTQTGSLKGKVAYMSPEQARGAAIDRRTDIFALGVILWEMIAGKRLFKCENDLATLQRIIYEPAPSLRDACPSCPDALVRIVSRALSLDPEQRHATAQELQLELEDLAHVHNLKLSTFALGTYLRGQFPEQVRETEDPTADGTVTDITASASGGDDDDDEAELDAFVPNTTHASAATVNEHAPPVGAPRSRRRRWWVAVAALSAVACTVAVVVAREEAAPATPAASAPVHAAAPVDTAAPVHAAAPVDTAAPVHTAAPEEKAPPPPPVSTTPATPAEDDTSRDHIARSRGTRAKAPHRIMKSTHATARGPTVETVEEKAPSPNIAEPATETSAKKRPFDPDAVFPP